MDYRVGLSSFIFLLKFINLLNLAEHTCYLTHKFVADTKSCTKSTFYRDDWSLLR